MAKGKGKSRNSNKKKGGGGGGGNRAGNISSSTYLKGEIPDFGSRSQANRDNYLTAYSRYKRATNRFMDYMRKNVPRAVIEGEEKNVIFLLYAADWMMASSHTLDPKVLKDLRVSIRMRKRVAKSYFGGGDATHKYFIDILVYCWTVLRLLPTETDERTALEQEDEETDDHRNLYAALGVEIDDEEEDDEETFPTEVPRPVPDKIRVTIDELMKADDRTDAIIFLSTMDDLMAMVANQYQVIYKNIKNDR